MEMGFRAGMLAVAVAVSGCAVDTPKEANADPGEAAVLAPAAPVGEAALALDGLDLDGQDPYATNCAHKHSHVYVPKPLEEGVRGSQVELAYSEDCGTNWAQVTRLGDYTTEAWVEDEGYAGKEETDDWQVSHWMYSKMWHGRGNRVRACAKLTYCKELTDECERTAGPAVCTDYR